MDIEVLDIDLGKTVCSLAGLDSTGAVVFRKRLRSPRSSTSRGGRIARNHRADQIGTGGRIKSESPGGCARNAQATPFVRLSGEFGGLCRSDGGLRWRTSHRSFLSAAWS